MKYTRNILRRHNQRSFTLIEVMLALAVAAIGMVAVLGLLPQGMQSARSAADNTISATIANQIFGVIRSQAFNKVDFLDLANPSPAIALNTYATPPNPVLQLYFDYRGVPMNKPNYYQANVQFQPPTPNPGSVTTVTVTLVWPALAKVPPNRNTFVTSVTAYP